MTLSTYLELVISTNIKKFQSTTTKIASIHSKRIDEFTRKRILLSAEVMFEFFLQQEANSFKSTYYLLLLDKDETGDIMSISLDKDFVEKSNFEDSINQNFTYWLRHVQRSLERC